METDGQAPHPTSPANGTVQLLGRFGIAGEESHSGRRAESPLPRTLAQRPRQRSARGRGWVRARKRPDVMICAECCTLDDPLRHAMAGGARRIRWFVAALAMCSASVAACVRAVPSEDRIGFGQTLPGGSHGGPPVLSRVRQPGGFAHCPGGSRPRFLAKRAASG